MNAEEEVCAVPVPKQASRVLAVLVAYQRDIARLEPWEALCAFMETPRPGASLRLARALIYDNSPLSMRRSEALPGWACYIHDPTNGGTARAYGVAAGMARDEHFEWILLLDQDTRVPLDFFIAAEAALSRSLQARPAALLPRVTHRSTPVSPSVLTWWGGTSPLPRHAKPASGTALTGIASGALVRTDAWSALGPIPEGLWLDYVDHWLFGRLRKLGEPILITCAVIHHDLSVMRPADIDALRLRSILDGEALFIATLPRLARAAYPFRLLFRALRWAMDGHPLAGELLIRWRIALARTFRGGRRT